MHVLNMQIITIRLIIEYRIILGFKSVNITIAVKDDSPGLVYRGYHCIVLTKIGFQSSPSISNSLVHCEKSNN